MQLILMYGCWEVCGTSRSRFLLTPRAAASVAKARPLVSWKKTTHCLPASIHFRAVPAHTQQHNFLKNKVEKVKKGICTNLIHPKTTQPLVYEARPSRQGSACLPVE